MAKTHEVTVLPGDGIGPEVVAATQRVLEATGVQFEWDIQNLIEEDWSIIDHIAREPTEDELKVLSGAAIDSIGRTGVALKGPTATPVGEGHRSFNVQLREHFGLFANVRPAKKMAGIATRWDDVPVDIVVFRENLEDLYAAHDRRTSEGAEATAVFTEEGCKRIAHFAFEYARLHGRKKITVEHKANILKETHGLFLRTAREVAKEYPEIECNDMIADNCQMQLIMHPERFDCILAPNFLGDLVSDICAGLVGGLGFAPGANIGDDCAVFEAVHGTAPDIVGKDIANPVSLMLSGAMLLEHVGEADAAARLRSAIDWVLIHAHLVSPDGRVTSTKAFTDAVARSL